MLATPKVFYTKEISPNSLQKIFEAVTKDLKDVKGEELTGKIGVKVSTGERGSKGYLKADLIGPLVKSLNGTILECNTAYPGSRNTTAEHKKTAEEHGFTSFAPIDILDEDGEMKLPVKTGHYLDYDLVGTHLDNYDSFINLAHGKGHPMGGFGANLKNQSIGFASSHGKAYIHTCGETESPEEMAARQVFGEGTIQDSKTPQSAFIESMAEAAKAVSDHLAETKKPIVYITIMNAISLLCDCATTQDDPVISDLGIVASIDPVANDQAFIDLLWQCEEPGAAALQAQIDRQEGLHILEYAQTLGLGSTEYQLITL